MGCARAVAGSYWLVAMSGCWRLAMVLGAATAAYAPTLHAADALPETDDPCGPLLAHVETLDAGWRGDPRGLRRRGADGLSPERRHGAPRNPGPDVRGLSGGGAQRPVRPPSELRARLARPSEPGWVNVGRVVACAVQDPAYLSAVPEWLADERHAEARAACFATLGTWPGAGRCARPPSGGRSARVRRLVRRSRAALGGRAPGRLGREMRDQLAPVLRAAEERQAVGYDSLRAGVCVANERWSAERAQICGAPSASSEARWREDRQRDAALGDPAGRDGPLRRGRGRRVRRT